MEIGERIKVQTKSFKGMATILYIAPGEFYPVQVEMDSPDPDGHKIYRVASHEIVDELRQKMKCLQRQKLLLIRSSWSAKSSRKCLAIPSRKGSVSFWRSGSLKHRCTTFTSRKRINSGAVCRLACLTS